MTLDLLDDIRIASPCTADWNDMVGDDRVRFCSHCQKNVYNLSAMPREEAIRLVTRDHDGQSGRRQSDGEHADNEQCIRFARRADGTVLTSDCPVGARAADAKRDRVRRRKRLAVAAGVSISAAVAYRAAAAALSEPACEAAADTLPTPAPTKLEAPNQDQRSGRERLAEDGAFVLGAGGLPTTPADVFSEQPSPALSEKP